jgi:glycosyltransferase involved in cell wall biosynthesis
MSLPTPRVSIGIPAYSRPRELRRAILSVLGQGVPEVEVVVGDDSGDLKSVVDDINDPRVVYHRNPDRLGMANNWTAVLDRTRGSLVGLLMDDDELLPGFLRAVLERYDASPDLGLVFTNHVFRDGTHSWARECALPPGRHDDFLAPLLTHRPVAVSAAVMRRDVWEQIRPLPDLLTADMVMHVRIALAGFACWYVDEPLMAYAVHAHQQSATSPRFRHDQVEAWKMFHFDDPVAERLRRHHLARALVSAAASDLRAGRDRDARESLAQARRFGLRTIGARGAILDVFARNPSLARRLLELWRRRPRRPTRLRRSLHRLNLRS